MKFKVKVKDSNEEVTIKKITIDDERYWPIRFRMIMERDSWYIPFAWSNPNLKPSSLGHITVIKQGEPQREVPMILLDFNI